LGKFGRDFAVVHTNEFCKIHVEDILDPVLNYKPSTNEIMCGEDKYNCCCDSTNCVCCEKIWVDTGWRVCRYGNWLDPRCQFVPLFQQDDPMSSGVVLDHFATLDTQDGEKCEYFKSIICPGGLDEPDCCGTLPNGASACAFAYYIYLSYDIANVRWKLHIEASYYFQFQACWCGGYTPTPGDAWGYVTCMWGLGYNETPNPQCPCMPKEGEWYGLAGCWCEGAPPQGFWGQVDACCGMTIQQATGIHNVVDIQNFCGCCGTGDQWDPHGQPRRKSVRTDYWATCYVTDEAGTRFCQQ